MGKVSTPASSEILSEQYLTNSNTKNDLIHRLKLVHTTLTPTSTFEIDVTSPEYPSIDSLTAYLISPKLLQSKDKSVRLYTTLSCIDLFYLYAPEAPWSPNEIIQIFEQITSQLSNLKHTHDSTHNNYDLYLHILQQLAEVKIGVVLVELCRMGEAEAGEMLKELLSTLISVVNKEHSQEIMNYSVMAISACVDEFDATIPTFVLDVLLLPISKGPTGPSTSKAASATPSPLPSYLTCYNVLRRCEDRLSSPIASLLNGLLSSDTRIINDTEIPAESVYAIVFELHRIAPNVLTTVVGNVTALLSISDPERRHAVVKLLGRLFYSPSSDIGSKFGSCYCKWTERVNDVDANVRKTVGRCLVKILENKGSGANGELSRLATAGLTQLLNDTSAEIRIEVVHNICDLASESPSKVPTSLLQAVGSRIASKSKIERKDAATGLAQIYQTHGAKAMLKHIDEDENCEIDTITEVIVTAQTGGKAGANQVDYSWIPGKILEAFCYADNVDAEMRSRIVQIVDDVLLPKSLSTTARATGLVVIVAAIGQDSNAYKFLGQFLGQRASSQKLLGEYLAAREKSREFDAGSESYLTTNAAALEMLENLVAKYAPMQANGENIAKIHNHKDKHIFKLMATITDPNHSVAARTRALDELPKRVASLGNPTIAWMKSFVRRVSNGVSICFDTINHCAMLAQECGRNDDWETAKLLLDVVKLGVCSFPELGSGNKSECFNTLIEFFSECNKSSAKDRKAAQKFNIVTMLSQIMAVIAPAAASTNSFDFSKSGSSDEELQKQLLRLCVKDGTPEQACHAIYVISALHVNKENIDRRQTIAMQKNAFGPLLKALTAPQRLAVDNERCVSILSALAALAETAPHAFEGGGDGSEEGRGVKAVRFALESVLLGRRGASLLSAAPSTIDEEESGSGSDSNSDSDSDSDQPKSSRKSASAQKNKKASARTKNNLAPLRIVAAIELLTAHITSLPKHEDSSLDFEDEDTTSSDVTSSTHCKSVFSVLLRVLKDDGLPPASKDRASCKDATSRSLIRKAAAVGLLRLCDSSKRRDKFLSLEGFNQLANVLCDSNHDVRKAVVEELSKMITGSGTFGGVLPNLKFLGMSVLCCDGDSGSNGGAANLGKTINAAKAGALQSIDLLRNTCDNTLLQCKSMGASGAKKFETNFKHLMMPEFALPFTLHLLANREETPSTKIEDKDKKSDDGNAHVKQLKKRLKWLLEPLITSLTQADNISFLLRMTEILSNYDPVAVAGGVEGEVMVDGEELRNKLRTVTKAAREVILKHVKTDAHLAPYPGLIQIPLTLFVPKGGVGGGVVEGDLLGLNDADAMNDDDNFVNDDNDENDHDNDNGNGNGNANWGSPIKSALKSPSTSPKKRRVRVELKSPSGSVGGLGTPLANRSNISDLSVSMDKSRGGSSRPKVKISTGRMSTGSVASEGSSKSKGSANASGNKRKKSGAGGASGVGAADRSVTDSEFSFEEEGEEAGAGARARAGGVNKKGNKKAKTTTTAKGAGKGKGKAATAKPKVKAKAKAKSTKQ